MDANETTARRTAGTGGRLPAEWEPHEATWLVWPHHRRDWPRKRECVRWAYAEIARRLHPGEQIRLLLNSSAQEPRVRAILEAADPTLRAVRYDVVPTDRVWTRDMGPVFVTHPTPPGKSILRFDFTGWARFQDHERDRQLAARVAALERCPLIEARDGDRLVVLEGGAVDVNGCGALLTTEECLLDPAVQVRNPGFQRADYERIFARYLGATQTIWLGAGLAGDDDTHGHVDVVARFVNSDTVALCWTDDPRDPNYGPLRDNEERLQSVRLADGGRLRIVRLPLPAPLSFQGRRLPASYANFYIGNRAVLVPTFNDPADRRALGRLAELFPDREVVGIHSVDILLGMGGIHCLTREEPVAPATAPG